MGYNGKKAKTIFVQYAIHKTTFVSTSSFGWKGWSVADRMHDKRQAAIEVMACDPQSKDETQRQQSIKETTENPQQITWTIGDVESCARARRMLMLVLRWCPEPIPPTYLWRQPSASECPVLVTASRDDFNLTNMEHQNNQTLVTSVAIHSLWQLNRHYHRCQRMDIG